MDNKSRAVMVSLEEDIWKYDPNSKYKTFGAPIEHDSYNKYYQNIVNALEDALEVARSRLKTGFHWSDCASHDTNNNPIEPCDCRKS